MLRALQQAFIAGIMGDESTIFKSINSDTWLSADKRLNIYRNSTQAILTKALSETFPVCKKLVGDDFFNAMGKLYMMRAPSYSPSLTHYGEMFAEFVADFEPAKSLIYLADVVRLEWAWHIAFCAADSEPLDIYAFSSVPIEKQGEIIFQLPAGASLIKSLYPIHRIWEVNQNDDVEDKTVNLDTGSVLLLVWRKNLEMRIDVLNDTQWQTLSWVQQSLCFADVCERCDCVGINKVELLSQLISQGWIVRDFPAENPLSS